MLLVTAAVEGSMKILTTLDPSAPSMTAIDFVRRMRWPAGAA